MGALLLEVADFEDPQHWRWVLKDSSGKFLQDQEVSLDLDDSNYRAFLDLQGYLDSHSSPDNRTNDQLRLLDEMGSWIGSQVLGKVADRLAQFRTSVTVRVKVPAEASGLAYLPLELARAGDRALALRDLSLVFDVAGAESVDLEPVEEKLRMLAVFSLPTDVSALALRRERYELIKLINRIAQTHSLAMELRVLQYGVTRDNLQEALEEGEGWDLIHLSGHGQQAEIILENPDGTMDPVSSEDLADLLSLARGRLKFVTLSSCLSAAATLEETLGWLKLWKPEMARDAESFQQGAGPMPALAQQLVASLDCAALAMRYPVGDDFAIKLAAELYERLLGKGQTLPRALQLSLRESLKPGYNAASPPLSLATPALFGSRAADLVIKPPKVKSSEFQPPSTGLAYFPDEPKRFVGRSGPMIRASSALAPVGGKRGVLFHGMAGAGKTACALELAYHHSRSPRFQAFVWHKAPDLGKDIDLALRDLAVDMEKQLPGFKMVHVVDDPEAFRNFLPIFKQLLESYSILIVLDNLESLLTGQDKWRDERWKLLVEALLDHDGLSRTILTSRRLPEGLGEDDRLIVEPIHALSLNEAALLARETPNLGTLLLGKSAAGLERGRELVARTLELVQGHPKLIELAEAQAGDPKVLETHLETAARTWGAESRLSSFFEEGESSQDAEKFLRVLAGWTRGISETLPSGARTLFQFLCALEEADRQSAIVEQVWPNLWKRLSEPGQAPEIGEALEDLKALVDLQSMGAGSKYAVHPGVAEAGLAELEEGSRAAVDAEMAGFWGAVFGQAQSDEMEGAGELIVLSGLRGAPYLMRLGRWNEASTFLEQAIKRDESSGTMAAVIPMLRRIADATRGTERELVDVAVLARALLHAGRWQEAEAMQRSLMAEAAKRSQFRLALGVAGDLFRILRDTGRLEEALDLVEEIKSYTMKAGLGPWTQLGNEGRRLQVLTRLGRYDEVLEVVKGLRAEMESLPEEGEQEESVEPWNVKEGILSAGRNAAIRSGDYQQALEFNAEVLEVTKARGATELELAKTAFNDYFPLLRLGRYDDAGNLLWACKEVFEREKDINMLGRVFSALADLEDELGRVDQAATFEETALRYKYLAGDPESISVSHHNLANLGKAGIEVVLAHRLADGIICNLTGSGGLAQTIQGLASDLDRFGQKALPKSFDEVCRTVEQVEGVRFRELFTRLAGPEVDGDEVLRAVVELAKRGTG
jgi:tetratricopeptide (TPR) repeat protein